MRIAQVLALGSIWCAAASVCAGPARAQSTDVSASVVDSDHDGLSDGLEQALLEHFQPAFHTDPDDCAGEPAAFSPGLSVPAVSAEDGTVYGQVTPRTVPGVAGSLVELHYFHLWKSDCGRMGHVLDTEHVAVLLRRPDGGGDADADADGWQALYWYAAAHEDTVCDASQIVRASALGAEERGAEVWISAGKHASFLDKRLCRRGCGGDNCDAAKPLAVSRIVNLGESSNPMNGALWTASPAWPLVGKMHQSNFDPEALARLERLPITDVAWVNPSKRPMQASIAAGGSTADALAMSDRKTNSALTLAGDKTGNALDTTYDKVTRSLQNSARAVRRFLSSGEGKPENHGADGLTPKDSRADKQ